MKDVIPDPDCEGFTGVYAGGDDVPRPKISYNYSELFKYLRKNNKTLDDLTPEELESFRNYPDFD